MIKKRNSIAEVFAVSFMLGLTSFGGPTAHIGYFHSEYVNKRKWLDNEHYADLVALCQVLPGPASSQVGMGIGMQRAGVLGAIAAWLGFTLPSALVLTLAALYMSTINVTDAGWLHGLKIVAVVVVVQAIMNMSRQMASEKVTALLAAFSTGCVLMMPSPWTQVLAIGICGLLGLFFFRKEFVVGKENQAAMSSASIKLSYKPMTWLAIFFIGLIVLPIASNYFTNDYLSLFEKLYRTGGLVFGGGHVILPLMELELVPSGYITKDAFFAGYSLAQAVPGPLFTLASFVGTYSRGIIGGIVAILGIFMPAFLLVAGVMPYWIYIRENSRMRRALKGINASVVGIFIAALYNPLWTSAITGEKHFVMAMVLFIMLIVWKLPAWGLVALGAFGGYFFL